MVVRQISHQPFVSLSVFVFFSGLIYSGQLFCLSYGIPPTPFINPLFLN